MANRGWYVQKELVELALYTVSSTTFAVCYSAHLHRGNELEEQGAGFLDAHSKCVKNVNLPLDFKVILVTNGVTRRHSELDALSKLGSPLPFAFPGKLTVVVVAPPGPTNPILAQVVKLARGDGSVLQVDSALTPDSLYNLFQQLAEKNYASFCGMLKCGNLSSKVILSPAPMVRCETLICLSNRNVKDMCFLWHAQVWQLEFQSHSVTCTNGEM
ncbi:snRNA metabolic process [Homalodisca vitripennis]|nr:snRNA metabolic process [Homalodisca vitripennis]